MMKRWQKILQFLGRALLVLLVAGLTVIAFFPGVLTKYLQTYANRKYLSPLGLRVSYSGFEGDILGAIKFRDFTVTSETGGFALIAKNAVLNVDYLRLLRRDLALDELFVERLHLQLRAVGASVPPQRFDLGTLPWVSIQDLTIANGHISQGDSQFWLRLTGELDVSDVITLSAAHIAIASPQFPDTAWLQGERFTFDGARIELDAGSFEYRDNLVAVDGRLAVLPNVELDLQFSSDHFQPPDALPQWLECYSIEGQLTGHPASLRGEISMGLITSGRPLDQADAVFQLTSDGIRVDRSVFKLGGQRVEVRGVIPKDGSLTLTTSFSQARLADFIPGLPDLVLDGAVGLEVDWAGGRPTAMELDLALNHINYRDNTFRDISGKVALDGQVWTIKDTTTLRFSGSDIQLWGSADAGSETLDLELYLQTDSLDGLLAALDLPPVGGRANGQVWASGSWDNPSVTGAVMLNETHYQGLTVGQAFIQFIMDSTLTHPRGRLRASTGDLDLLGVPAEGGEAEFIFKGDTVYASTLRLYQGMDKLDAHGYISLTDHLQVVLDTVTVWRNTEVLTAGHATVQWAENGADIRPATVEVAGGTLILSGKWFDGDNFAVQASADEIDMERLLRFLGMPTRITGTASAAVDLSLRAGRPVLTGTLAAAEGEFDQLPFSNLHADFSLLDRRLDIQEFVWQHAGGEGSFRGALDYTWDPSRPGGLGALESIDIQAIFVDLALSDLRPVLPWRFDTEGSLTGKLTARGPAEAPIYSGDFRIEDPRFDRVVGERLEGHLRYDQQVLAFSDLALTTASGSFSGGGTLPIDLRPTMGTLGVVKDAPVDLAFAGATSRLDFLTPYFADIDSINGDFDIELSLTGTFRKLVRNGRVTARNGRIELFIMENPIVHVQGDLVIEDNLLSINRLEGRTPRDNQRDKDDSHLAVSGTMDMTRFFKPYFNLQITGEKVYFTRPLKEIEVVGSPSFTIVGRDSIYFLGQFTPEPNGVVLRLGFAGPESYALRKTDEGTIVVYNIHVPLYSGATVDNGDVNAEIEGEITLLKVGSEEFRFAGSVDVISGSFVYNGYEFLFDEGRITFESSTFNPQFFIRATTQVEPDMTDVTLVLSGTMEDHLFSFEYSSAEYTESDLLQLFALGKNPEEAVDPALSAGLSIKDILLRRIQEDARQASGLDRFRIQTTSPRTLIPSPQQVRIHLGKRLTPRLYVGLQADPTLSFNQYQIAYRLNRNLSVVGSIDENGLYQGGLRLKIRY